MFSKLKEKLKNWTKKVSEEAEEIEQPTEEAEKVEEIPKESSKEIEEPKEEEISEEKNLKESEEEPKEKKGFFKKLFAKKEKPEEEIEEEIGKEKTDEEEIIKEKIEETLQKEEPKKPEKISEIKEEPKQKPEEEKPGTESFFKKITSKVGKVKISEKEFEIYSEDLEMLLLENNVAFEVAEKIIEKLKEEIIGKELLKKEVEEEIKESFKKIIREILVEPFSVVEKAKEKKESAKEPYVILFCGINGSGKTTTTAKVAEFLKNNGLSCVIAAGDTFRAASIEQIKTHGEKLGIKVISHEYGSDPASIGFDAIQYAKKNSIDCVLIDTAGRIHTAKNLLKEIEKVARVCNPDLKIFVGESITGNDAVEQAKSFDWAVGLDGIVLTKADIDEKGGTALSVGYVTKKPILYLGTGQEYEKIEPFDKEKFIERLGL